MSDAHTLGPALSARLEAAAADLLTEVARLPAELITWVPADGVWSVLQNLRHVEEFIPYWTTQTQQVVAHPDQQWGRTHGDTDRLAAVDPATARSLPDVERGIRSAVERAAQSMRDWSDADLAKTATSRNPRWGLQPASFILEQLVVQHVEKHLGQVRRNVAQFQAKGTSGQ